VVDLGTLRPGGTELTRVAAVDCGTNSIRLLIADVDGGQLADVHRELRIVRLGQGVDGSGRLAAEAIARTRDALADYADLVQRHGASMVRMVATSATRDAVNRDEFVAMVTSVLGVAPEVITARDEAVLSFAGAVFSLPHLTGPVLVADIGGGSTELIAGATDRSAPLQVHSMDVGCVRMTERHLRDDPPTAEQIAATVHDVRAALDRAAADVALGDPAALVGVAGTVTTIAALAMGLDRYDPGRIHGAVVAAAAVDAVTAMLLGLTHEERATLPVMHAGRVDVIGGGALVLRTLMEATGAPAVVASEHDILDGIALGLAGSAALSSLG
jgi:exopolyphosphatase / guanosine-5'-triphosphate,3'-diphosphate pyrophosphatase